MSEEKRSHVVRVYTDVIKDIRDAQRIMEREQGRKLSQPETIRMIFNDSIWIRRRK